jgi:hypothetical protein
MLRISGAAPVSQQNVVDMKGDWKAVFRPGGKSDQRASAGPSAPLQAP